MRRADLQLLVNQRKPACVLDPALVLCHDQGLLLATKLAQVMEPWLTRSFWQALDASDLLMQNQHLAATRDRGRPSSVALKAWISLREGTDAGMSPFRWCGDRLPESQLLEAVELDALSRYEALAESLQRRSDATERRDTNWCARFDEVEAAHDALVLSALLDGAVLLSAANDEPAPVQAARAVGLPTVALELPSADSLFAVERGSIRLALATAGLSALLQSWPQLAVAHVLAGQVDSEDEALIDPWSSAKVWWYRV